jgi:hypothetical protein
MHDALEAAQAACDRRPKDAEAWWLLAVISRHANLPGASDEAFRRAAALSRARPLPYRLAREKFQELVGTQMAELSPDARRRLAGVRLEVEALPDVDDVKRGTSPEALTARKRNGEERLILFQVNYENRSGSHAELSGLIGRSLSRA